MPLLMLLAIAVSACSIDSVEPIEVDIQLGEVAEVLADFAKRTNGALRERDAADLAASIRDADDGARHHFRLPYRKRGVLADGSLHVVVYRYQEDRVGLDLYVDGEAAESRELLQQLRLAADAVTRAR